jgi:hypothetical protein
MDEINSQSRNFALSTVARKTHVVIYGITSKIDSDRSFHHPSVAADCVVAVILKINFYSFLFFLISFLLDFCLFAFLFALLANAAPSNIWHRIGSPTSVTSATPGRGARNGAVVGRIPPSLSDRVDLLLTDSDPLHSVSVITTVRSAGKSLLSLLLSSHFQSYFSLVLFLGGLVFNWLIEFLGNLIF